MDALILVVQIVFSLSVVVAGVYFSVLIKRCGDPGMHKRNW